MRRQSRHTVDNLLGAGEVNGFDTSLLGSVDDAGSSDNRSTGSTGSDDQSALLDDGSLAGEAAESSGSGAGGSHCGWKENLGGGGDFWEWMREW